MNQKVQLRQRQEWDVLSDKLLLSIRVSEVTLDRVSDYTVTTSYKFIDAYVRKISVKSNESDVRMNDVCGIFGGGGRGVYTTHLERSCYLKKIPITRYSFLCATDWVTLP